MKSIYPLLVVFALLPVTHAEWKPSGEGWVSLFNGKDLSGWKTPGAKHTWQVIDGVIDYDHLNRISTDSPQGREYMAYCVGHMRGILQSIDAQNSTQRVTLS